MSTAILDIEKKTLVPQLRFREFGGEWEDKKLGEITSWASGGTPPKDNPLYWDGHIPWISASSMRGVVYSDSELKITYTGLKKGSKLAQKGSLLILVRGSMLFNKIPIGIVSKDVAFNQDVKSIIVDGNSTSEFILNWFTAFEPQILNMVTGTGIGAGKLDLPDLKALKISIPTLPEQQKIASFLTAVDEKIQQLTRKATLLEQYKKGVMQQLFSGKLRFKDANGKDYGDWEEKKLGEVLKIGNGKDYKHLEKGNIPVFGTGGYMLSVNKFLHSGETVFIGRKGTIDKPFYFKGDFWTVDTLFYTHAFKNSIPKFIYCVFQQINWKLHNEASGVPSLSKSTIEKLKFEFPCLEEQQKIANFLSNIDNKIEGVNQQLAQTQAFKKGLLQRMFV